MDRFDGKKVIICQVSDGISKADELIDRAIKEVPVYDAANVSSRKESNSGKESGFGHQIYTAFDERCIAYASICSRRWYSDRTCIPD